MAKAKYKVKVTRGGINWGETVPNIIASFFYIWERDWRNNYVQIVEIAKNKVVKEYNYSIKYMEAAAKKKFIEEDLIDLSVNDFEKKYINV